VTAVVNPETAARKRVPRTFVLYVVVGVLTLAVDVGTLAFLYEVVGTSLWWATTAGFWLSFVVNFLGNKYLTFSLTSGGSRQLLRYGVVVAFGYVANLVLVLGLTALGLPAVVSKLIAVGIMVAVNFFAYRLWVFRD
jgi:putative flippase GtrA